MWLLKSGPDGYRQSHSHQMPQVHPPPLQRLGARKKQKGGFDLNLLQTARYEVKRTAWPDWVHTRQADKSLNIHYWPTGQPILANNT